MKCAIKKGFFVLQDCGGIGTSQCGVCRRHVCNDHVVVEHGQKTCTECLAKEHNPNAQNNGLEHDTEQPGWRHKFRRGFYSRHHFSPFYMGVYHSNYYDNNDYRSFNQTAQASDTFDDLNHDDADFFDS